MYNLFRFIGLRHLVTRPIRTFLTTLGVALGVSLFIAIELINRSTLDSFRENIEGVAGKAKITVSSGEAGFPEDRLDDVKKIAGVRYAAPMIQSRAYLSDLSLPSERSEKGEVETLVVLGVDLLQEQSVRSYKTTDEQVIDDPLVFLNQPDSVILTHEFAKAHGFKENTSFYLATAHGRRKFTVRGMLSPDGPAKAFGGAIAIMDIDGARATFGKEGKLDRIDVIPAAGEDVEEIIGRIQKKLGPGYRVERPETQSAGMERMVKSYQVMMTFFSTFALLVGIFLVANSISISVAERRREIGSLRALGATRPGILILFMSEAMFMGGAGAFAGAWMGRVLASVLQKVTSQALTMQYLTKIEITHFTFGVNEILRAVVIGAGASLIASVWPAYRATKIQPLEAMKRGEAVESNQNVGFLRWSPYLGFFLLFFVTISAWMQLPHRYPRLEYVNQGLSVLGAALFGPGVVVSLVRLFRPMTLMMGSTVTRLAQDNLLRNPKRTASNVMSLMVGLILVILIAVVDTSFRNTIVQWFDRILRYDLVVSSNGQVISYQAQPLDDKLAQEIGKISGIKNGPEGVKGLRFVHIAYQNKSVAIKAYDEPNSGLNYATLDVIDRPSHEAGYELYHTENPVLLISENFALHFKKKRGDFVDLATPSGLVRFRIIGICMDYASDVGVFYLSRKQYSQIWKDNLVNAFGIQVEPHFDPELVRKEIDKRFGRSMGLIVVSNLELKKEMVKAIDDSFKSTHAIEFAALIVGLLGLLNTLLISVMERMREIGMLRAVGMSRPQVSAMILQEALFQGGFGAFAAVTLGSWLAFIWVTYRLSDVLGWVIQFHFPWSSVFVTMLTGLGVALVAGVFPAYRAARLEITEALEYE